MMRAMGLDEIALVSGLEAVRLRPHLYVGDVRQPDALHALVEGVLCLAFDDALGGVCTRVDVAIEGGVVTVRDDGPGLSVETDPATGLPVCELLLTRLLACRAMRRDPRAAKRFCGGGIAVTTALSAWLEVEIARDGRRHRLRFVRGEREVPLADVGATEGHGTTLRFLPDPEIFGARLDPARLDATLDEIRADVAATVTLVMSG